MRFFIDEKEKRILSVTNEKEITCCTCKEREWQKLYFCEQDKKLYCRNCLSKGKGCIARMNKHTLVDNEHIDYKIDMVEINKVNPKHIMNKSLLQKQRS